MKYEVMHMVHRWIKSYLADRMQPVYLRNLDSVPETLCHDVQGSVLGPLLFIIYTGDMDNIICS